MSVLAKQDLTSTYMQWVQIMPFKSVPMVPTTSPAFFNASGMARIPVPLFSLNKWIIVYKFLKIK